MKYSINCKLKKASKQNIFLTNDSLSNIINIFCTSTDNYPGLVRGSRSNVCQCPGCFKLNFRSILEKIINMFYSNTMIFIGTEIVKKHVGVNLHILVQTFNQLWYQTSPETRCTFKSIGLKV